MQICEKVVITEKIVSIKAKRIGYFNHFYAIVKIKNANGEWIDIPAIKGEKGDTPIKGVDYFTEEDRQAIVDEVVATLPVYNGEVIELWVSITLL